VSFEADIKKAYAIIDTKRKIVGVKLLATEEEYNFYKIEPLKNPLSYCVAVKSASLGHRIKFNAETSGCGGSSRVLGLAKPSSTYYDGTDCFNLGLYKDKELAKQCASQIVVLDRSTYGVVIQPIEYFSESMAPDVVLIICNPRECMRIMQGYSYHYGVTKSISMSGNQGICSELTAYPLKNNTINVSFLCSGTRYLASWEENEAAAGMPFSMFSKVIDGVYQTINPIEMDERKQKIQKNLQEVNINDLSIEYGKTYYTELEKLKREMKKDEA
jgi:uncharacterized protein (DUF169 family)